MSIKVTNQSRLSLLRKGTIKRVHVDRAIMARNRITGNHDPAITVQTSKGSIKSHRVKILGPSEVIHHEKPLSCGARAWVETTAEIEVS